MKSLEKKLRGLSRVYIVWMFIRIDLDLDDIIKKSIHDSEFPSW